MKSRNFVPSRKGCVANAELPRKATNEHPPPGTSSLKGGVVSATNGYSLFFFFVLDV